jgi:hypothetical protein
MGELIDITAALAGRITDEEIEVRLLRVLADADRRVTPDHIAARFAALARDTGWAVLGSDQWLPRCERGALPLS